MRWLGHILALPYTRVADQSRPTEAILRARAVERLAAEACDRQLAGKELYAYITLARLGTDAAIDLLLALLAGRSDRA